MSVYAGIDVHRKRSQVAVVGSEETVALNRNVVDGKEPVLKLIGGLPAGTPVAVDAAFGWGWLADLLENYGFEAHLVQPSAVQGDRFGQAEERQGRCGDLGAVAAGGSAARGLDRVSGGAPVAGAAAPPGQPGAAVHPAAQPDPRRGGRLRLRPDWNLLDRAGPRLAGGCGAPGAQTNR